MTHAARERMQVRLPLLFVSASAWALLAAAPGGTALHHHRAAMSGPMPLGMMLVHNPPASLAAGWAVMVAAMMAPLLLQPVGHVRDRSFARRRARAVALFLSGYTAVWMAAGLLLLAVALTARVPLALAVAIALAWEFSPAKQRCLNRGHSHSELAAFGPAADLDALRFGWTHGAWCVGSCWALMLLPLLLPWGHVAAMAAVTSWLFAERLESPRPPRWRLRGPGKAVRLAAAQTRMLIARLYPDPAA